MNRGWLLDSSALAQAHRPEVAEQLEPLLRAGLLYTCPVLDLEALATARTASGYRRLAVERREAYRGVPLQPAVGERALSLQGLLTRRAHVGAADARDLVVAATALEHNLSVLHYRQVFELLAELCDLDQHPVAPLGSLR
jgi:predicted nucleic acid-binding protein